MTSPFYGHRTPAVPQYLLYTILRQGQELPCPLSRTRLDAAFNAKAVLSNCTT